MKDIIEGYKQMLKALIGLIAISPLIVIVFVAIVYCIKVLYNLFLWIW